MTQTGDQGTDLSLPFFHPWLFLEHPWRMKDSFAREKTGALETMRTCHLKRRCRRQMDLEDSPALWDFDCSYGAG